jgi:hypothetical protein
VKQQYQPKSPKSTGAAKSVEDVVFWQRARRAMGVGEEAGTEKIEVLLARRSRGADRIRE